MRFTARGGYARTYKDPKQAANEDAIAELMEPHLPPTPLKGALAFGLRAYVEPPKSKPKKWREYALAGKIRPTSKPDLSNIIKHIEDVANARLWADDAQIVEYILGTGKYYGSPARYEIEVIEL